MVDLIRVSSSTKAKCEMDWIESLPKYANQPKSGSLVALTKQSFTLRLSRFAIKEVG